MVAQCQRYFHLQGRKERAPAAFYEPINLHPKEAS
jgi:hypothetical protein